MATGPGICRKPSIGMWTHLLNKANGGIAVDEVTSFFVGGKLAVSLRADKYAVYFRKQHT